MREHDTEADDDEREPVRQLLWWERVVARRENPEPVTAVLPEGLAPPAAAPRSARRGETTDGPRSPMGTGWTQTGVARFYPRGEARGIRQWGVSGVGPPPGVGDAVCVTRRDGSTTTVVVVGDVVVGGTVDAPTWRSELPVRPVRGPAGRPPRGAGRAPRAPSRRGP